MTTLSSGTTAAPDVDELLDPGVRRLPHKTVQAFKTLDPQILLAELEKDLAGRTGAFAALADAPGWLNPRFAAGHLLDWCWQLYEHAFRELNKHTVQRHMMYRHEFDELMKDTRQLKFLAFNTDGDVIGLSAYSNQLDAVHLLSTDYFETHHPEHYAGERVWWVSFVAVVPEARGMTTFNELIKAMFAVHGPDALTGIDYAKVNIDIGLARAAVRYLQRLCTPLGHDVTCEMVDYQGYFLHGYPKKAEVAA